MVLKEPMVGEFDMQFSFALFGFYLKKKNEVSKVKSNTVVA